VRNSAAHFTKDYISKQDAEDAIAFTEALLDYLYVLTARFNALKERRTKATSSTQYGSRISLADQGDLGVPDESGAFVEPS
jgi:hypothetical protein